MRLEQLIEKFWKGETSTEENQQLLRLLRDYRNDHRDTMQNAFYKALEQEMEAEVTEADPAKASDLLKKIHLGLGIEGLEEKQQSKYIVFRRMYKGLAVAASISLLVVSTFMLIRHHTGSTTFSAKNAVLAVDSSGIASSHRTDLSNGSDSVKTLRLEDGSLVQLGKNSRLSFYKPFRDNRRDIQLEGDAIFTVAKDRSRPFTVYAEGIATQALGTRFSVNTSDAGKVRVRLLEGKVVINAAYKADRLMNDVYLIPGQELLFDRDHRSYTVNKIESHPVMTTKSPEPDNKPELVFNKEPLSRVFHRIGILYKAPVVFQEEQLQGLYFTGTFLKSDDLHIVLSAICNVNDLVFTEQKDSIIITRSH